MPSWNIHTAHVEELLANEHLSELGIHDEGDFLFGNLVPDIYVGYVVPGVSRKILYQKTHYADPEFIPAPNAALFYELYVRDGVANDVTLGAWAHLICDHYYNLRTNQYISRIGVQPGEQTRIRKQSDFDVFGRTLDISLVPVVSPSLLSMCASFKPYSIAEQDVRATVRVQNELVQRNAVEHVQGEPEYSLLTREFFRSTYEEVADHLRHALHAHAAGGDPTDIGRP